MTQLAIENALTSPTVADVWEIYYPGLTPQEAYEQHRAGAEQGAVLWRAVRAAAESDPASDSPADVQARWDRLATARREAHLHRGVPEIYLNEHGRRAVPLEVCEFCWRSGADATDRADSREFGFHARCRTAAEIRCDLRSAAWALIQGDTDRAADWERRALATHLCLESLPPTRENR